MMDEGRTRVRSIEELILSLHPVKATEINLDRSESSLDELRKMKRNVSAVLAFTSYSRHEGNANGPEFKRAIDELRRECLLINGMISRILFRRRWLFSLAKVEDAREVLAHYRKMADAARRMCLLVAPESENSLRCAF